MSVYKGSPRIDVDDPKIVRWSYRKGGGPANEIVMRGRFEELLERADDLSQDFEAIDIIRLQGTMFELRAAQQGDDIDEEHDVDGNNFTQSTLMNLAVRSRFVAEGVTVAQYNKIASTVLDEVNKKKAGSQTYVQMESAVQNAIIEICGGVSPGNASEVALDLLDDLDRNGEQFLQSQYVYRHSVIVAERIFRENNGTYAGAYADTHKIFTEHQLRTAEQIPAEFALPKKVSDPAATAEWLKNPTRARIGRLKRSLITEYLFADEWSRVRYEVKA